MDENLSRLLSASTDEDMKEALQTIALLNEFTFRKGVKKEDYEGILPLDHLKKLDSVEQKKVTSFLLMNIDNPKFTSDCLYALGKTFSTNYLHVYDQYLKGDDDEIVSATLTALDQIAHESREAHDRIVAFTREDLPKSFAIAEEKRKFSSEEK